MQLHIMGVEGLGRYVPDCPTYVIRCWGSHDEFMREYFNLDSPLYRHIDVHEFDDRWPSFGEGILFTEEMARGMLGRFSRRDADIGALLVHCVHGKTRSPAVGMALNEIFGLGHDPAGLKERFPEFNTHVYQTLLRVSQECSIATSPRDRASAAEQKVIAFKRLFIPLSAGPYEDFLCGRKRFEVRMHGTRYNEETVYEGRPVELRKGYSGPSLHGKVGRVVTGSIEDILTELGLEQVHPRFATAEAAIADIRRMMPGAEKYIAFECLLESLPQEDVQLRLW